MAGTRPTAEVRLTVLERDNYACVRCWSRVDDIHHRHPAGMGGSIAAWVHLPANLVSLCRRCHRWTETRERALAIRRGLILPTGTDPLTTALWLPIAGPVLLDNDGGVRPVKELRNVEMPY